MLQEGERGEKTIAQIARAHGITETASHAWRREYGGAVTRFAGPRAR
jgi:transposase-like protein